jgi:acyl phosphate:glycerol-3-phosphate acyltransferase
VLRTGNKGLAAATLLLDAGKGAAAVLLMPLVFPEDYGWYQPAAGLAALIGHCFPVWLRFKGGKGVATLLGVSFALDWRIGFAAAIAWLAVARISRISSVGGLSAAVVAPLTALIIALLQSDSLLGQVTRMAYLLYVYGLTPMAIILVWQHRANITRLRAGTEPKIGQKSA